MCGEQLTYFTSFDIINGGLLIDNQRIPLTNPALSTFILFNGDKLTAISLGTVTFLTIAPVSVIEARFKQQNVPYTFQDLDIEQAIQQMCVFYNLNHDF